MLTNMCVCGGGGGRGERGVVARGSSLPKSSHTYPNDETWQSYTLPKEDPKTYKSGDTAFEFYQQNVFIGNQQFLLYQEIKMEIAF